MGKCNTLKFGAKVQCLRQNSKTDESSRGMQQILATDKNRRLSRKILGNCLQFRKEKILGNGLV